MTLVVILLAIIAFILWKIYRQKQSEIEQIDSEKADAAFEEKRKERFKDYPHIFERIDDSWIQIFGRQSNIDGKDYLLKSMFLLMLGESTKIDFSDGSLKYDSLWDATKELLEHLEKFHEGSVVEHEIALATYWQQAATKIGELIQAKPSTDSLSSGAHTAPIDGQEIERAPFTDIEKIAGWFPKKHDHPEKEISFIAEDGSFPRHSEGSKLIDEKMRKLGL